MTHQTKPNSWVYQDTDSTTQLTYALQIDPAPFTVSIPAGNPVTGSLEFVLTNGTGAPVTVNSVAFILTIGSTSDCITQTTAGISASVNDTTNWNVIGPESPVTGGTATYTLEPLSGSPFDLPTDASVVVQIFGFQTITVPGNSTISIKEITQAANPNPPPATVTAIAFSSFIVTTFPTGFYFDRLSATVQSGSSLVPVAQINTGSTVTLTWNSSVVDTSAFQIYYSDAVNGQQTAQPSNVGEWTSPALACDTVFTVAVTISADGGQPLTASMTTSIAVQNPSLVAAGVNIINNGVLSSGSANVSGLVSADSVTVTTGLTADSVTATTELTTATANVTGLLTAASANVTGNLTAASSNITDNLTTGSANITGALTVGSVSGDLNGVSTVSTNELVVNSIINASGGTNMIGTLNLCGTPDYVSGTVGIGGNVQKNSMLTVTNTQTSGYGVYINAPYMQSGGWGLYVISPVIGANPAWYTYGDINLKKDITPYSDGLTEILKINPIKFHYNEEAGMGSDQEHVGVSAQDLQEIAPYMVGKGKISPDANEEYFHMNNSAMTYMLVNAVKELKAELDALKAEVVKQAKKK